MSATAIATSSMNDIYRYQRFIYDATRRYFLLGRLDLIAALNPPQDAHILEVGCGTAWNLIHAARTYPRAHLYGFDISSEMLNTAVRAIDRKGLRQRILLAQGDATCFDSRKMFSRNTFDRIFVSYALSMIPGWTNVLTACERALGPNGQIHLVDFGQCEQLPAAFRKLLYAWLARFSVTPRTDLQPQLEQFAEQHDLSLSLSRPYRGYAVYAVLQRKTAKFPLNG